MMKKTFDAALARERELYRVAIERALDDIDYVLRVRLRTQWGSTTGDKIALAVHYGGWDEHDAINVIVLGYARPRCYPPAISVPVLGDDLVEELGSPEVVA